MRKSPFHFWFSLTALLLLLCVPTGSPFLVPVVASPSTAGGLDPGFNPIASTNDLVTAIAQQSDGKVVIGGYFTQAGGLASIRLARFTGDGLPDAAFNAVASANGAVLKILIQPDEKILIAGVFNQVDGQPRKYIARLNSDGSLDETFIYSGLDASVRSIALQADGKILVGGLFQLPHPYLIRLNANGSLDASFDIGTGPNFYIEDVLAAQNGMIYIAGAFTQFDGQTRNYVARLNADGSLDAAFNPGIGPDGLVYALAQGSSYGVYIAGNFAHVSGSPRRYVAHLSDNGALDSTFDTSNGPDGIVYDMAYQPNLGLVISGSFSSIGSLAAPHIARLTAYGSRDNFFNPGIGPNGTVRVVEPEQGGKLLIGGDFALVDGRSRAHFTRLMIDGSVDTGFEANSGPNSLVTAIQPLDGGKTAIGGWFSEVDGVPSGHIARLNANGVLDKMFQMSGGADNTVLSISGHNAILLGGSFTHYNGEARGRLAFLDASGMLMGTYQGMEGANNLVRVVAMKDIYTFLIGGDFNSFNGVSLHYLAKTDQYGNLDSNFNHGFEPNGPVYTLVLQPNGKILIGGSFTRLGSTPRLHLARLNLDGSLDASFNPGADDKVAAIDLQPDGRILVSGWFTQIAGHNRHLLARLNADGSIDDSFNPTSGPNGIVSAIDHQSDGKILIGGSFTSFEGSSAPYVARLLSNGTLDPTFNAGSGPNGSLYDLAVEPTGQLLIAGNFSQVDGVVKSFVARLQLSGPPSPLSISNLEGTYGYPFTAYLTSMGYPKPTVHLVSGSYPPGVSLDSYSTQLAGTPTKPGVYPLTLAASNYYGPNSYLDASITIAKAPSQVSITSITPEPSLVGQAVSVHFSVLSQAGSPTGNVTVQTGDGALSCSGSVASGSCNLTFSTAGNYELVANYSGDSNFLPAGSPSTFQHVVYNPPPTLASLDPSQVTAGGPGITLVVNGSGFLNGATVYWKGSARNTTYESANQLRATIPAGNLTSPGTAQVTVVNPLSGGQPSNALSFTILAGTGSGRFSYLPLVRK